MQFCLEDREYDWPVGDDPVTLTLVDIPVAKCPVCGYTYTGDDTEEAERQAVRKAISDFWVGQLREAGASAAVIIRLKMVFLKAVVDCKNPRHAAEQLGSWLVQREQWDKEGSRPPVARSKKVGGTASRSA